MTFDLEMASLIQRYLNEVNYQDLSIEEILLEPRWKRVWIYWLACEKYKGEPVPGITMEECKSIYGD